MTDDRTTDDDRLPEIESSLDRMGATIARLEKYVLDARPGPHFSRTAVAAQQALDVPAVTMVERVPAGRAMSERGLASSEFWLNAIIVAGLFGTAWLLIWTDRLDSIESIVGAVMSVAAVVIGPSYAKGRTAVKVAYSELEAERAEAKARRAGA